MTPGSDRSFNLIRDAWIPVLDSDGQTRLVSLREAFSRAREIRDLACGPAERISLLRLFICIAQASQATPSRDDSPEWEAFAANLVPAALEYLDRDDIKPCFELLGDGPRFLQFRTGRFAAAEDSSVKPQPLAKLSNRRASGNNPTIWDHVGEDATDIESEEMALSLLTFLNYSCLTNGAYPGRAPCINGNAGHVYISGPHLFDWIAGNCISMDAIARLGFENSKARPVWEVTRGLREWKDVVERVAPSCFDGGFLPRLTPITRALWLLPESRSVVFDNTIKFRHLPSYRELSCAALPVARPKKDRPSIQVVELVPSRKVWRDLPAYFGGRGAENEAAPATLCRALRTSPVWIGGLVTGKRNQEKNTYDDDVDSLWVDGGLLIDPDLRSEYARAMHAGGLWEEALTTALNVAFSFLADAKARGKLADLVASGKPLWNFNPPRKAADTSKAAKQLAATAYWSFVEQSLSALFDLLRDGDYPEEPLDHPYARTAWHGALREAAARAYRLHAPRGNARQLEAFTLGLRGLWPKNPTKAKSA